MSVPEVLTFTGINMTYLILETWNNYDGGVLYLFIFITHLFILLYPIIALIVFYVLYVFIFINCILCIYGLYYGLLSEININIYIPC